MSFERIKIGHPDQSSRPPTTPAVVHFRGASFEVLNPHNSLQLHEIETPGDIDSEEATECVQLLSTYGTDPNMSSGSRTPVTQGRKIYPDVGAAVKGIRGQNVATAPTPTPPRPIYTPSRSPRFNRSESGDLPTAVPEPLSVRKASSFSTTVSEDDESPSMIRNGLKRISRMFSGKKNTHLSVSDTQSRATDSSRAQVSTDMQPGELSFDALRGFRAESHPKSERFNLDLCDDPRSIPATTKDCTDFYRNFACGEEVDELVRSSFDKHTPARNAFAGPPSKDSPRPLEQDTTMSDILRGYDYGDTTDVTFGSFYEPYGTNQGTMNEIEAGRAESSDDVDNHLASSPSGFSDFSFGLSRNSHEVHANLTPLPPVYDPQRVRRSHRSRVSPSAPREPPPFPPPSGLPVPQLQYLNRDCSGATESSGPMSYGSTRNLLMIGPNANRPSRTVPKMWSRNSMDKVPIVTASTGEPLSRHRPTPSSNYSDMGEDRGRETDHDGRNFGIRRGSYHDSIANMSDTSSMVRTTSRSGNDQVYYGYPTDAGHVNRIPLYEPPSERERAQQYFEDLQPVQAAEILSQSSRLLSGNAFYDDPLPSLNTTSAPCHEDRNAVALEDNAGHVQTTVPQEKDQPWTRGHRRNMTRWSDFMDLGDQLGTAQISAETQPQDLTGIGPLGTEVYEMESMISSKRKGKQPLYSPSLHGTTGGALPGHPPRAHLSPNTGRPTALRNNTFQKLTYLSANHNLTGTPSGTGMQMTGSSPADTSSPGMMFSSSANTMTTQRKTARHTSSSALDRIVPLSNEKTYAVQRRGPPNSGAPPIPPRAARRNRGNYAAAVAHQRRPFHMTLTSEERFTSATTPTPGPRSNSDLIRAEPRWSMAPIAWSGPNHNASVSNLGSDVPLVLSTDYRYARLNRLPRPVTACTDTRRQDQISWVLLGFSSLCPLFTALMGWYNIYDWWIYRLTRGAVPGVGKKQVLYARHATFVWLGIISIAIIGVVIVFKVFKQKPACDFIEGGCKRSLAAVSRFYGLN
ncbi:hypothetical protein LTR50_004690 [Elasticomyces elasticus]|nr:hypothetical protein LTR50_004690 [Elasticomyces elasticus]